jgi:hypothetical protein
MTRKFMNLPSGQCAKQAALTVLRLSCIRKTGVSNFGWSTDCHDWDCTCFPLIIIALINNLYTCGIIVGLASLSLVTRYLVPGGWLELHPLIIMYTHTACIILWIVTPWWWLKHKRNMLEKNNINSKIYFDTSKSRSEIPGKSWNAVLVKAGDQSDWSSEKWIITYIESRRNGMSYVQ